MGVEERVLYLRGSWSFQPYWQLGSRIGLQLVDR